MKTFKPNDPKFVREQYMNPLLIIVFSTMFTLQYFDIEIFKLQKNLQFYYSLILILLTIYFLFKTTINLFYKITITEDLITIYTPFNLYNKRIAFTSIDDIRLRDEKHRDDTLVFFLDTNEVVAIGINRYSKEQKEEILKLIKEYSNL